MPTGSIGTTEILDDTIAAADIATDAVSTSEIATNGVDSAEIATDAVGNSEIATSAVGTSEIADGAVANADLTDDTVDWDKIIDSMTLDAATTITRTSNTTSENSLSLSLVNSGGSAGTDQAFVISNGVSTNSAGDVTTEALLVIDQADTNTSGNTTVTDGLLITKSGSSNLTNAITIGSGTQSITKAINIASTGVTTDLSLQNGETIDNDTDGTLVLTVASNGTVNVATGNLKVGNGTPGVTQDGEDGYVEGTLEVDGGTTLGSSGATNGTAILGHFSGTATNLTSASIAAASCGNYGTITVTGAAVGDTVYASPDATSSATGIEDSNLAWNAAVTAANTVTIRACNPQTIGAVDAGDDQEWRADVWHH